MVPYHSNYQGSTVLILQSFFLVKTTTCDIPNCVSCPTGSCCSECEDDYEQDGCICTKNERNLSTIYLIAGNHLFTTVLP